jgi:hypothetical protein
MFLNRGRLALYRKMQSATYEHSDGEHARMAAGLVLLQSSGSRLKMGRRAELVMSD